MSKAKQRQGVHPLAIVIVILALAACITAVVVIITRKPASESGGEILSASSPDNGGASQVSTDPETVTPEPMSIDAQSAAPADPTAPPTEEPTPVTYPVGDFTATFPDYDTGTNADYSYQSGNVRIAITTGRQYDSNYYVADVYVRTLDYLMTMIKNDTLEGSGNDDYTHNLAAEVGAIFAVNGDFCGDRDEGVVIRNGKLYRSNVFYECCVLYQDGTMEVLSAAETDAEELLQNGAVHAWSFGPRLLNSDGSAITDNDAFSPPLLRPANPRTIIGYIEPGHYVFVVVDGRTDESDGMTFLECSEFMSSLGCKVAYNLDGGQSSEMVFQGEIVNVPYNGGRSCSDIVYIKDE
ncbi:MAG: phosphodiester glycosidase family protein [Clostridia bacterium]|nr:phosphodiester glycosidase family protein [Clostridia bacterium]